MPGLWQGGEEQFQEEMKSSRDEEEGNDENRIPPLLASGSTTDCQQPPIVDLTESTLTNQISSSSLPQPSSSSSCDDGEDYDDFNLDLMVEKKALMGGNSSSKSGIKYYYHPTGPREPETLHSWSWLTSKCHGISYLLNERLREVGGVTIFLAVWYCCQDIDGPVSLFGTYDSYRGWMRDQETKRL